MNKDEFKQLVYRTVELKKLGIAKESVKQAIHYHVAEIYQYSSVKDVKQCVRLAESYDFSSKETNARIEKREQRARRPALVELLRENTSEAFLTSETLVNKITPWVENTRKSLFRTRDAPFSDYDQARDWLLKMDSDQDRRPIEDLPIKKQEQLKKRQKQAASLRKKIVPLIEELNRVTQLDYRLASSRDSIPYIQEKHETIGNIPVTKNDALRDLALASQEMAKATGFSQVSIVAFILANIKPILPLAYVDVRHKIYNIPTGGKIIRKEGTIKLALKDISHSQFFSIYKHLRSSLGITKVKPLKKKDEHFIHLVDKLGGEPSKGKVRFWKEFSQEWNQEYPTKYKDWRGPKRYYDRLIDKLDRLYVSRL